LNDEFAEHVGADAYCMDAGSAVETMKKLVAASKKPVAAS